jgi:acyl-CoA synthetase (AMP-forming)/AMP-acid ligase II
MADISTVRVDDESMPGMLRWQAVHRPDATAVVCGECRLSYADLDRRSDALARGLLGRGVRPQDRVAVLLGNRAEYLEIYEAAARSGLVLVPVNTQLSSPEIEYILEDSGAVLLVTDVPGLTGGRLPTILLGDDGVDGYEALIAGAPDVPVPLPAPDTVFFQGYTSGTTGRPKGCVQRSEAFVAHHRRSFALYRHDEHDVMLMPGPLFHEAPALFSLAQLFFGGTVVVMPRFEAATALETIERERVTMIGFAVPTMLDRIVQTDDAHDTSSLRAIVTAGAPLRADTCDDVLARFPTAALHEFYGGTEIGIITAIEHRSARAHGTSVGTPVPGSSVLLLDDADREVPVGEIGLIHVSPVMMEGYHGRPEATQEATRTFDGVPWLTLGDLGRLDEDGHLHLVDRKNHMIISGGENVYPAEVESVLMDHPGIVDVAVLGLPDPDWGEVVTAVVTTDGPVPDLAAIREFCAGRLAGYKTPRKVIAVDEIPRTASGKILKHVLRGRLQ